MKAIVEVFGAIPHKIYLVTDDIAEQAKETLERKVGITTPKIAEDRAINGKEEFFITDISVILERATGLIVV